ncbi:type II secretion system protein N [Klebsiella pneumoniae]|nr:type II secretion system protein N [Klebsiella pneumoniae]
MKANWIAGGLLLVLYLLWLTATAPARLLAPMLPPGVQVGQVRRRAVRAPAQPAAWMGGAAQPVSWYGERVERLAWALTRAGWQVSLSDPRGVMGQARLWGLRDLRLQEGRLTAPASLLSRWLMSTMPVKAAGEVTFSLTEGRFSDGRCRHIIAGGAQWRQARLHSPVGSLELAQVNGTFRCTVDGAVALTLRQDSHQLSLSGQGTLSPDGRYLFRGTLQPRQGMPPLLALLVTRPTANNAPGPTPWQLQGKWLPQEQK